MRGAIVSINLSKEGGVPKLPVSKATVGIQGIVGDYNWFRANKRNMDPGRAVSLYSHERIVALQEEGHPIEIGSSGENLTVAGVPWDVLQVGTQLRAGEVLLELSEPCAPCGKISGSFMEGGFSRIDHDVEEGWSRWLASVVEPGVLEVGDWIRIEDN